MTNTIPLYRKALWIAEQINEDVEDCYDVLLGNIKGPSQFVAQVEASLHDFDTDFENNT